MAIVDETPVMNTPEQPESTEKQTETREQEVTVDPDVPTEDDAPEVDLEKIEAERRQAIEAEIDALPVGPVKVLRTHGLPKTVYRMVGDERKEVDLSEVVEKAKQIGVYFSASWCEPCQAFTPKLIEAYKKINSEHYASENAGRDASDVQAFELILIPVDKTPEDHDNYFAKMPWMSADYAGVAYFRMRLCTSFGLESIPTLLLFDTATGNTLTEEGVDAVERHGESLQNFPWEGHTKPLLERFMNLLISKLPLLAVMAFMMFRNYNNPHMAAPVTTTTTTTTTAAYKAVEEAVKIVADEL